MKALAPALLLLAASGCAGRPASSAVARLAHPDPAERLAAVHALDRSPDPEALRPLLRLALGDADPRVRQSAALALEAARGDSVERLALEELAGTHDVALAGWLLESRLEAVRLGAIEALQGIATPAAWARLSERMGREDSAGVRVLCARALALGLDRGAGPFQGRLAEALRRGLKDPEVSVRRICARALALAGEPCAAGVLAEALREAPESERGELLELLRVATGEDLGQDPGPWVKRYGGTPAGAKV